MDQHEIERRAARVKLLLMDCDGVLTDGRITFVGTGDEQKSFHARDGQGLVLMHSAGLQTGIISGRWSSAVERRAAELGITYVRQRALDKLGLMAELAGLAGVDESEIGYIGDDIADLAPMERSGIAVAVADAAHECKAIAHYTTLLPGGFGAVREVCELILKAQGRWHELTSY